MTLGELREKLKGSDDLTVVVVTDTDAFEVDSVEAGQSKDGRQEFWIVTGDPLET